MDIKEYNTVIKKRKNAIFPFEIPLFLGPISVWIVLFVFGPLAITIIFSLLKSGEFGKIIPVFTLNNYYKILKPEYLRVFIRSFLYALSANILCLIIGYPVAYLAAKHGGRWKSMLILLIIIPSWTSYLIRLYALKTIIGNNGIINSILLNLHIIKQPMQMLYKPGAVIFGLVYSWIPFMILPIYSSLEGINPELYEASLDLGAKPLITLFKVAIPLTKGGIFAGTILVFVPALGDWLVPHFLGGSKVMMIGNLVEYKFINIGNIPEGASLATLLAVVIILILYTLIKIGGEEALEKVV